MVAGRSGPELELDLNAFPSIAWLEPEYSMYSLRQASRRSWRIGQGEPVVARHLIDEGTLQAETLALVAAKMRSPLMVEGELPEDGLAALEGDGHDVFVALAKRLTEPDAAQEQSLEALFAPSRAIEVEAESYLVDSEWTVGQLPGIETDSAEGVTPWDPDVGPAHATQVKGRVLTFEELGALLSQRRTRPRPVPEGQLALFGP